MSAALSRRDEGCASDLALDRWLLGELPGSDEGRKLEQHVRGCPSCSTRLKALRSLYQTVPAAASPVKPVPSKPPRIDPATDGVMQVAILRDGLLVGTQVFTPGHYSVGSAGDCDLMLEDLESEHAQLYFRAGHTAVESTGPQMFINGFPMKCATVRPIDEICVGPYVLRVRIIQSRWEPVLKVVPPPPPTPPSPLAGEGVRRRRTDEGSPEIARTEVVQLKSLPVQLKAQLLWGDTLLETAAFDGPLKPDAFDRWGFEPLRKHLLATPVMTPAFRVHVPRGVEGAEGDVELQLGESLRFEHEGLVVVLSVTEAPKKANAVSWKKLPWTTISMAAMLALGFAMFAAFAPDPDTEVAFIEKPPAQIKALLTPPEPKHQVVAVADASNKQAGPTHHETPPRPVVRPPPPPRHPPGMGGLVDALKTFKMDSWKQVATGPTNLPIHGHTGPTVGLAAATPHLGGLSFGNGHDLGIGATGLLSGAGKMGSGTLGHGGIHGQVTGAGGGKPRVGPGATIDRDAIAKVINSHLQEISACYEKSMLTEGQFGGKISIEWAISGSGLVASAKIANATVKSASLSSCVLEHLKRWQFPRPTGTGNVTVSYPFMFTPSSF